MYHHYANIRNIFVNRQKIFVYSTLGWIPLGSICVDIRARTAYVWTKRKAIGQC